MKEAGMTYNREEKIVLDFISAYRDSWPDDMAAALLPLAEDAYYQIVVPTIPPVHGREHILAEHNLMRQKVSDQRHEMLNIASHGNVVFTRSEARRVGKECVSTCRSWGGPSH